MTEPDDPMYAFTSPADPKTDEDVTEIFLTHDPEKTDWSYQEKEFHWHVFAIGWDYHDGRGWNYDSLAVHVGFWTFYLLRW